MTVFHVDLDNTLIYSYKHDIGADKINVELYQSKEISFITRNSYKNLQKLKKHILIVPTSTRSIEQYRRINLHIGAIPYALACNGGVLLIHGQKDESWYADSLQLIRKSLPELEIAKSFLEQDIRRKFELRFIEKLFLFTKCDFPEDVVKDLKDRINTHMVDAFHHKEKVYVLPANLNKGMAVKRFRAYNKAQKVIAAGDSWFDKTMLQAADIAIAPHGYREAYSVDFPIEEMSGKKIFSDEMLEKVLELQ